MGTRGMRQFRRRHIGPALAGGDVRAEVRTELLELANNGGGMRAGRELAEHARHRTARLERLQKRSSDNGVKAPQMAGQKRP